MNMIKVRDCESVTAGQPTRMKKGEEIYPFTIVTPKRTFTFSALSAEEQQSWVSEINSLSQKKRKHAKADADSSPRSP